MTLQQQSHFFPPVQIHIPPPNPLFYSLPPNVHEFLTRPVPFAFSSTIDEQPTRIAPFVFDPIMSSNVIHPDDEVEDENYEPSKPFEPIVHLSPVDVKTGEEDENILFCERAKLYRFDSSTNEMKARGTGEIKILQHKTTNLCRVLMRREQVLKLCANHKITSQMELEPYQGSAHSYLWSATDYSDGEAKHEILCVKFKTDEQAKKFARIFNEAKNQITHDYPSIGKISLNDDDIILIGEMKPTLEQIERAKKFQLPLTFYLYENKKPCKGCRGCKEQYNNRMNSYDNNAAAVLENPSNFPSGFFPSMCLFLL
jgi:E3 SUMO-protein ligase RanBP2